MTHLTPHTTRNRILNDNDDKMNVKSFANKRQSSTTRIPLWMAIQWGKNERITINRTDWDRRRDPDASPSIKHSISFI